MQEGIYASKCVYMKVYKPIKTVCVYKSAFTKKRISLDVLNSSVSYTPKNANIRMI